MPSKRQKRTPSKFVGCTRLDLPRPAPPWACGALIGQGRPIYRPRHKRRVAVTAATMARRVNGRFPRRLQFLNPASANSGRCILRLRRRVIPQRAPKPMNKTETLLNPTPATTPSTATSTIIETGLQKGSVMEMRRTKRRGEYGPRQGSPIKIKRRYKRSVKSYASLIIH